MLQAFEWVSEWKIQKNDFFVHSSLLPEEVMLEGVACLVALENNETSGCEVMSGGVTLFLDGLEGNEEVLV
jgi:hypothetical protein